eukprot:SM000176S03134  [mRNA]  locus=s176:180775:186049:+ [translate_table: standard]
MQPDADPLEYEDETELAGMMTPPSGGAGSGLSSLAVSPKAEQKSPYSDDKDDRAWSQLSTPPPVFELQNFNGADLPKRAIVHFPDHSALSLQGIKPPIQSTAGYSYTHGSGSLPPSYTLDPGTDASEQKLDPSERRLRQLGYKQELRRSLNFLEILSVSMAACNPYITVIPFYQIALSYGGPQNVVWPWWPTAACALCAALVLSEICSSFPTTGSLYFWAASMAPAKWKAITSWVTAWLEVVALIVTSASVAYPATQIIQQIILLASGGMTGGGYYLPKGLFFLVYAALEFSWAIHASFSLKSVSRFLTFTFVYFNIVFLSILVILLPLVAPTTKSASWVFTHYEDSSELTGVSYVGLNWMFATLLPQFSFFGYDQAAHVTEETKRSDMAGPKAIIGSLVAEIVLGYSLIVSLTFSIQGQWKHLFSADCATGGEYPFAQIIYDIFHGRYHDSTGAIIILVLILLPFYASGVGIMAASSRAIYAISRDGAMPGSNFLKRLNASSKVPVRAAWLSSFVAIIIGLTQFGGSTAFLAILSVATIAWNATYFAPIFFRLIMPRDDFIPGPFHLGWLSKPLCIVALAYILYTDIMFMVPLIYPITLDNFNYGPVAAAVVLGGALLWWAVSARKWFVGPVRTIDAPTLHGRDFMGVY